MTAGLLWLLPGLPAAAGALLCLVAVLGARRPVRPRRALVALLTATVALGTTALAGWALLTGAGVAVGFLPVADLALAVDPLAGATAVTVGTVATLVLLFATAQEGRSPARFAGLMLLFVAAVMVTVTAGTLPTLLLGWELMGATSYALIGFEWTRAATAPAATLAFVTTRAGDLGLYLAAGAAVAAGTGLELGGLAAAEPGWRTVIAAGIGAAALGKAAQLPLSFWLSRAMEGPSPVSALLHSAAMVAMGGYLLLRTSDLLTATPVVAAALAWVGALTALLLGLVALAQHDLKQLLAASTAAQLGFVVLAAGIGATTAGTIQLIAHAGTKALLFLVAGAWLAVLGSKQLADLRGVARRWRTVGVLATVGLLSLAGLAPLALWAGKEAVLAEALHAAPALYAVGLAASAVSAGYAGTVLRVVWAAPPEGAGGRQRPTERIGWPAVLALAVLGLSAAGLGVLALPAVTARLRSAFGDADAVSAGPVELALSVVLAAAVLGLTWRRALPAPCWARGWLGLETVARRWVVAPTDALAGALARFDDRALHAGVLALANGGLALARTSRRADDRGLHAAVLAIGRALRAIGRLVQRPQSGQLHQYYTQSAVLLAVAVVLLVLVR